MKKYVLNIGGILCFLLSACGQSLKKSDIPAAVLSAVEGKYPKSSCKWEKEDANYEASLKKDGKEVSLLVNPAGEILETETSMEVGELPAAALSYLKQQYAGKSIRDAAMMVDKNGVTTYEAALKGKDIIFDNNGNFLKEVKD